MKPSQYLLSWFTELFGNPGRYVVVGPGKELPRDPSTNAKVVGDYTIFPLDGATFRRREVIALMPLTARLIEIEHGGPRVQEVVFESDSGRQFCVQHMPIDFGD